MQKPKTKTTGVAQVSSSWSSWAKAKIAGCRSLAPRSAWARWGTGAQEAAIEPCEVCLAAEVSPAPPDSGEGRGAQGAAVGMPLARWLRRP